jgi:hypothetical protein
MPGRRRSMADLLEEQQRQLEAEQRQLGEPVAAAAPPPPGAALANLAAFPASSVPQPHSPAGDGPLNAAERADLSTCETALDNLRMAFWAAGKALQVIRDGRLYRAEYPTFDAYCEGRWQMHRSYADKLIRAWPLAETLSPIGLKELNEGQVRELLPLAAKQGEEAAVIVYETACRAAAEVDGVRVTAAVLKGAIGALPDGQFDKDQAVRQIREYVARLADGDGNSQGEDQGEDIADEDRWAAEADRVRAAFRKALSRSTAKANPAAVRELLAELRTLLDEVEQAAL